MSFTLCAPTGSIQYSFPVVYVFESLYALNPRTEITPRTVGQIFPDGRAQGLGQV